MAALLKKLPVLGALINFLKSPTGLIFRANLYQQRLLAGTLLVLGNSMAAITSARVLLGVVFLQVITGGEMSILPAHWFSPEFLAQLPLIGDYKYAQVVLIAGAMVSLSLVNFGLEYMQKVSTSVLDVRFAASLRKFTTDYTLTCDASFFAGNRLGEISYLFSNFATAVSNILNYSQMMVTSFLRMLMVLGVIFYLDQVLTVAIMFAAAFLWPIMTFMQRRMHKIADQRRNFDLKANGLFADILYAIRLVKQSNQQDRLKGDFYGLMGDRDERQVAYAKATALSNSVTQIFGMATVMGVALTVFVLKEISVFNNIGFLLGYIAGVSRFFSEVTILVNFYTGIGQEVPHLNAMNKLLEDPTVQESYYFRGTKTDFNMDTLSVQHCSYAYNEGIPVLKDVSFEAKAGTVTAILGLSGSGKSTLFELIAGYRAAPEGTILVGGTSISDIDIKAYRGAVGYLTQETMMFNMPIRDNIAFIKAGSTEEEIIAAAKKAQAHQFILEQQFGYDTRMGERGGNVSGGQRQRVALARTFLQDPKMLLLDEATSALDFQVEKEIMDTVFRDARAQNKLVLVATHRLVTVANADQILFVHHGEVVERGTHKELMALGGLYSDLYHFQTQAESIEDSQANEAKRKIA